jgi:endonuclease/exonuclease/phosphatase family metal-dependent hydrolase
VALASLFRLAGYFSEPRLSETEIHAVTGEPARLTSSTTDRRLTTVVTWNIERGVQFDQIVATLRSLAPDVILLQEVDRYCRRSSNRDVARELGQALGMNWVAAGEFQEVGEALGTSAAVTGQAILSREPIADPHVVVFTDQSSMRWRLNPMQPRRGGRIALSARTAGLLVYSLHLESGGSDAQRSSQLREVLADEARQHANHVVLAGDFNNAVAFQSFMFAGLAPAGFSDALGSAPRQTSMNHRHPIDWMFVKGVRSRNGRVERIEGASDHYPLVATITR